MYEVNMRKRLFAFVPKHTGAMDFGDEMRFDGRLGRGQQRHSARLTLVLQNAGCLQYALAHLRNPHFFLLDPRKMLGQFVRSAMRFK